MPCVWSKNIRGQTWQFGDVRITEDVNLRCVTGSCVSGGGSSGLSHKGCSGDERSNHKGFCSVVALALLHAESSGKCCHRARPYLRTACLVELTRGFTRGFTRGCARCRVLRSPVSPSFVQCRNVTLDAPAEKQARSYFHLCSGQRGRHRRSASRWMRHPMRPCSSHWALRRRLRHPGCGVVQGPGARRMSVERA